MNSPLNPDEWWVDTALGDDANPGTRERPLKTFAALARLMPALATREHRIQVLLPEGADVTWPFDSDSGWSLKPDGIPNRPGRWNVRRR